MLVDVRILGGKKYLILTAANPRESELLDLVLGSRVKEDGLIAAVTGEVRLSDGYLDHYICLERKEQ